MLPVWGNTSVDVNAFVTKITVDPWCNQIRDTNGCMMYCTCQPYIWFPAIPTAWTACIASMGTLFRCMKFGPKIYSIFFYPSFCVAISLYMLQETFYRSVKLIHFCLLIWLIVIFTMEVVSVSGERKPSARELNCSPAPLPLCTRRTDTYHLMAHDNESHHQ